MNVYVLTSISVTDGVLFPYEPQVFRTRKDARGMLRRIRNEELMPEYVDICGYSVMADEPDQFIARHGENIVRLSVDAAMVVKEGRGW